jgi:hypothetical protein
MNNLQKLSKSILVLIPIFKPHSPHTQIHSSASSSYSTSVSPVVVAGVAYEKKMEALN